MEKIFSRLNKNSFKRWGAELAGAALYALAFIWLILPLNLYSGNLTGFAQVISDLANRFILHSDTNFTGTILFIFNIPLFILAFCKIGKILFCQEISGCNDEGRNQICI